MLQWYGSIIYLRCTAWMTYMYSTSLQVRKSQCVVMALGAEIHKQILTWTAIGQTGSKRNLTSAAPGHEHHLLTMCVYTYISVYIHFYVCVNVHMGVSISCERDLHLRKLWNVKLNLLTCVFQISVPLSCLPKYSDNDVPGSTSLLLDGTMPEVAKCYHEMQFYEEGSQWRSKQDPCTMCNCHQNLVKCDTVPCPQLKCSSKTAPGECCPTCTSESA
jgi:hypothetical protein